MAIAQETRTPRSRTAADFRAAGATSIAGAATMLTGTGFWAAAGADIDAALDDGTVAEYLVEAAGSTTLLTANLGLWILGVVLLGIGGLLLARLGDADSPAAAVARFAYIAGPAAAIVFFSLWLGIVLGLAPAHAAGEAVVGTAAALAHAVSTADWVATILIVAVGAAAVAQAGRDTWVPRWLFNWALVALAAGGLAIVGLLVDARSSLAMPVVPVGLGWTIAAGITAVRRGA